MDRDQFWDVIEEAHRSSEGDNDALVARVIERLRQMPEDEIIDFDHHFRMVMRETYQSRLWAAAYIMNGGCSDDGFEDFRGWLIAQGQAVVEAALRDPETLLESAEAEAERSGIASLELLLYASSRAYDARSGQPREAFDEHSKRKYPDMQRYPEIAIDWDEDDLPELLPRLFARFGEHPM